MKIVVTGAAGFIGSNLAKYFANRGDEVLAVDIFRDLNTFSNGNLRSFGHFKNLLEFSGDIYCGDICEVSTLKIIADFAPNAIFHQAAISDTTVSEQNEIMRVNLNSFSELLKLSLKCDANLVYASSGATYGNAPSPQCVNKSENPLNAYGFSKLMMDKMAQNFCLKNPAAKVVGLRYFNVYGAGEFYKNKTASMILQFGLQMLKDGKVRLFEGSQNIYRDFVYIKDILFANELGLNAPNGVYNVATSKARSFSQIVDILENELDIKCEREYIKNPFTKGYQFHTQADLSTSQKFLKYTPKFSLELGIKDYKDEIKRIFKDEINA